MCIVQKKEEERRQNIHNIEYIFFYIVYDKIMLRMHELGMKMFLNIIFVYLFCKDEKKLYLLIK